MKHFFAFVIPFLFLTSAHALSWTVTKSEWTEADEADYSRFVEAIGLAREQGLCITTESCIKNAPGNFLRTSEDAALSMHVDCADLPYALRSYFAMKRGLPFVYSSAVVAAPSPNGEPLSERSLNYSSYGNLITAKKQVIEGTGDFNAFWYRLINRLSSAMYRTHPIRQEGSLESDLYSVDIRKASTNDINGIRPGTIIYDPNGHVAVIYKIGKSGRIFFIDAHPDNSLTRGSYGQKFARSRPVAGAGFRNFRPFRVVNGRPVFFQNNEIADFSTTQYFGTHPDSEGRWSRGKFILNGTELEYYDYVRAVMANGNISIDPVLEVTEMTDGLCLDIQDRVNAVAGAVKKGIHNKAHISRLPFNIYGTSGEWEEYSTPSRDARLKTSFKELHDNVSTWLKLHVQGSPRIAYSGSNLEADLNTAYNSVVQKCRLRYTKSDGTRVRFTINDVVDNLWKLSFSPYHCVELRWGGIGGTSSSCNDPDKMKWYRAQQKLRNQIERTYETRMSYTADELISGSGSSLGVATSPAVDVRTLLN